MPRVEGAEELETVAKCIAPAPSCISITKHDCSARRGQLLHAHGASEGSITSIGLADKMIKTVRRTRFSFI